MWSDKPVPHAMSIYIDICHTLVMNNIMSDSHKLLLFV